MRIHPSIITDLNHTPNASQLNIALSKTATIVPDHSISILEPDEAELYALQCIINQAAAISISSEVKELSFESIYANQVQPAFLFFVLLYDEPLLSLT